ncbi:unnamed protein product [Caenorhabditis angaria]|uniref:Uncharacterized protein n=1 Tax=Caenorhabditis angaria TaxID=860376 RepID=A0A9P1MUV2_9PELO|nr:unnamed protein product [Caenorhabditis angaria]
MLRVLYESRNNQMDALNDEITTLKCQVDELKRENDNLQMRASVLGGELLVEKDKHKNCAKEIKDVRNTLKKAENRATKEENRANSNQIQLNDAEEKAKSLRKELDSVKKKSAEERTKTKKEKDRDTQTIRAQANEINAREKERDRAMGDLEDMRKVKDRVEKENGRLNSQLGQMVDRARSAEASVLEARMSGCLDVLNRRKTELQSGFDETQKNLNIVRQASDRDLLRKSLTEWRTALDKCDQHIRSTTSQYESSIKNVRSGSSTLSQIGDIKIPSDPLPKLVKPPPVQVVAPSSVPGVIGQRSSATTSAASRTNTCSGESPTVSACSTPSRSRVSRLPSPVNNSSAAKPSEPNNFWSWNTIGNLGSFGESSNFNSSFDQLHRDIWAMNGNGSDFQRSSSLNSSVSAPQASRQISAPPQISQAPLAPRAPATSTNSTTPFLTGFNTDIWNYQAQPQQYTPSSQQQPQRLANYYGAPHNGAGDQQQQHQQMSNGSALFANLGMLNPLSSAATNPWRAPPTSSNSNSATSSSQNPPPF